MAPFPRNNMVLVALFEEYGEYIWPKVKSV